MSFRPHFPGMSNMFSSYSNNGNNITMPPNSFPNHGPPPNSYSNSLPISNSFTPRICSNNNVNRFFNNTLSTRQQPINTLSYPGSINTENARPSDLLNAGAHYNHHYSNQRVEQNSNTVIPFNTNSDKNYFENDLTNSMNQNVPFTVRPVVNCPTFQNKAFVNVPVNTFPRLSQIPPPKVENGNNFMISNLNNSFLTSQNVNFPAPQAFGCISQATMNVPQLPVSNLQCHYSGQEPLHINVSRPPFLSVSNPIPCSEEIKLSEFLASFSIINKKKEKEVIVPEFRYALKTAMFLLKLLSEKKRKLSNMIDANENEWKSEVTSIRKIKEELSSICNVISAPVLLKKLTNKLKMIQKKRVQKKKTKQNKLSEKVKAEENRKEINEKIDKLLDDIKEKNLKLKREAEMKKEADFILLEVRRKIHEANRTIEKIKIFEKLRIARQTNAVNKGLHISSEHNERFEKKMSILRETMQQQLVDYEAEEKALKVMLETEQEGQLEAEAQWKIKKAETLKQKRHNHIKECLFGNSDDPLPTDSLYLFHKYHTSANSSIENLVKIRHQWDVYLDEDGTAIPKQWVVPVAANSTTWEKCLNKL